jgi:WD40 repeat protein
MRSCLSFCLAMLLWVDGSLAQEQPAAPVSFSKQVAPILLQKCTACHGQTQPKGGFQLHTFEALQKPGDSGESPVSPGKPDESQLYLLISSTDQEVWMPKEADRLSDEQIALVKRWIEEGAKFDGPDVKAALAAIVPTTYDPPPEAYRVTVPITALAFSPQGTELAVGGYNEILIYNVADGALVRRIKDVAQRTYGLAYKPDGSLLAAASGTPGSFGEVKLFDPASGAAVRSLGTFEDVAFGVAFSASGEKLAACAADRSIRIYDVASGAQEVLIEDHADWVLAIAWSPEGTKLASASRDKTSKVFDAKTGESQTTYNGHGQTVYGVAWSADGNQVFSSGGDRKVHVWAPGDAKKIAEIGGYGHEVYRLELTAGQLVSCSADKSARLHDGANRNQVRQFSGHVDWVYTLSFHAGTKRLATGSYDGEVRIWNTEDGANLLTFKAAPGLAAK